MTTAQPHAIPAAPAQSTLRKLCGWGVHLYTAMGAVLGLLAIHTAAIGDFRASFVLMAATIVIDSSDGTLARMIDVKRQIPWFDGALLDNIVDYLTYVVAPVFLLMRAQLVRGNFGIGIACIVLLASAYQFCQADAKTEDHFFLGFPSYWNIVVFYLFCMRMGSATNALVLLALSAMVFVPIKYIYPSRTVPLRPVTIAFGVVWGIATLAMLPALPRYNPILLYLSLSYVAYYFLASFALHVRATAHRA